MERVLGLEIWASGYSLEVKTVDEIRLETSK